MAEPRKLVDINVEYTSICAQIGEKQFIVKRMHRDIDTLLGRLETLDLEAEIAKVREAPKVEVKPPDEAAK